MYPEEESVGDENEPVLSNDASKKSRRPLQINNLFEHKVLPNRLFNRSPIKEDYIEESKRQPEPNYVPPQGNNEENKFNVDTHRSHENGKEIPKSCENAGIPRMPPCLTPNRNNIKLNEEK